LIAKKLKNMKANLVIAQLISLLLLSGIIFGLDPAMRTIVLKDVPNLDTLCTPNPSDEAVALYRFLHDMFGRKILSGQMWVPWGINEIEYIEDSTGRRPAIAGFDYIDNNANNNETQKAINYWNAGGIPTIMYHWGAPGIGEGYEASQTYTSIDSCFTPGTDEYDDYWFELDRKADQLIKLRNANVPVLWRPFHELNGGWFWWSMEGPEQFKRLWIDMYNYFVNVRGLNNLIWVLCYTSDADLAWYPGDAYVDIIGCDTYDGGAGSHITMFNEASSLIPGINDPVSYHECGVPPDPDLCIEDNAMWSWWMQWHTAHLTNTDPDYLRRVYNHDLVITLDEVPDIMNVYNWNDTCTPSEIMPYLRIDGGDWLQTSLAGVLSSTTVTFRPEAAGVGNWSWSGCGTSGSENEQTITVGDLCTATATFVNECGATSTQTFNIYNDCVPSTITPHLQVDDGEWQDTSKVTIHVGSSVTLSPEADTEGAWSWSGCGVVSTAREITVTPTAYCIPAVTFTNYCGKQSTLAFKIYIDNSNEIPSADINYPIRIYPIPCNALLTIELSGFSQDPRSRISIYSIDGAVVHNEIAVSTIISINTTHLQKGLYFIKVENSEAQIIRKLVKE
jgi:hypothetical protein